MGSQITRTITRVGLLILLLLGYYNYVPQMLSNKRLTSMTMCIRLCVCVCVWYHVIRNFFFLILHSFLIRWYTLLGVSFTKRCDDFCCAYKHELQETTTITGEQESHVHSSTA